MLNQWSEQKMIDSLALHGIQAKDLVPALMTTHTVANPEYDPIEAKRLADEHLAAEMAKLEKLEEDSADVSDSLATTPKAATTPDLNTLKPSQTTTRILEDTSEIVPGVSTHLTAADKDITLDIRWTVLCDLFLVLIADSVYDARSRVLLENVALKLGLGWLDVVKFERRVTEALEIEEGIETLEEQDTIKGVQKATRRRRFMMLGLATLGAYLYGGHGSRLTLVYRRWSCHWTVCGTPCARNRCGSWSRFYDHRYHRDDWLSRRNCWSSCYHYRRCPHGLGVGCAWYGEPHQVRPDIRYSTSAQQ